MPAYEAKCSGSTYKQILVLTKNPKNNKSMNGDDENPVERIYIKHKVEDLISIRHSVNGSFNYYKFPKQHREKVDDFTKYSNPFFKLF